MNRKAILLIGAGLLAPLGALPHALMTPDQLLTDRPATLKATVPNSFDYEIARLAHPASRKLTPVEDDGVFYDKESKRYFSGEEGEIRTLRAQQSAGLSDAQAVLFQKDGQAIGLPAEIRLYAAGAASFHAERYEEAIRQFQAVLDLPEAERRLRTLYASFMIGRANAAAGNDDSAIKAFAETRRPDLPDPSGLAVASYGEEARLRLRRGEVAQAIDLYADQAAAGSRQAVDSLRLVAYRLTADRKSVALAADLANARRLIVADLLARAPWDTFDPEDANKSKAQLEARPKPAEIVEILAEASRRHEPGWLPDGDLLANLAYREGKYDLAGTLLEGASGPLASWIKAKMALQEGDLTSAAKFYGEAVHAIPAADDGNALDPDNRARLIGENGVVMVARGEFTAALDSLFTAGMSLDLAESGWNPGVHARDALYVAERVLTIEELKSYVDAKIPVRADQDKPDVPGMMRDLLARRLMRAGRYAEAAAYFSTPDLKGRAADYAAGLNQAEHGWTAISRAAGWYEAAVTARRSGMEIIGSEGEPDFSIWGGDYVGQMGPLQGDELDRPLVTAQERERFRGTKIEPDQRFHYRYLAVQQALHAADLLPPRSQAYGAVLCEASNWLQSVNQQGRAWELYLRYVNYGAAKQWCAGPPDFARARFTVFRQYRHLLRIRYWLAIGTILTMGLGAITFLLVRKFRPYSG